MPMIHVRSLRGDEPNAVAALRAVAPAVAEAVPCSIGSVWCTFGSLDAQVIGERVIEREARIVCVELWMRQREDADAAGRALVAACVAVADALDVPLDDVWGTFTPVEPGRVFTGGGLVADRT